eukprot:scaffold85967_cov24-Prasinocladus_malaysianus.AAC.1
MLDIGAAMELPTDPDLPMSTSTKSAWPARLSRMAPNRPKCSSQPGQDLRLVVPIGVAAVIRQKGPMWRAESLSSGRIPTALHAGQDQSPGNGTSEIRSYRNCFES